MPAPVVYVVAAVVGTVATVVLFKEFVYEPHIAPKLEAWATTFIARRQARRRQSAGAVPVPASNRAPTDPGPARSAHGDANDASAIELERLVAREVNEWRTEVGRSQSSRLRRRTGAASAFDQSNPVLPYAPIVPTHVIFDPSTPSTPTSECVTRRDLSPMHTPPRQPSQQSSRSTLRSPPAAARALPAATASPDPFGDASLIAPSPSAHAGSELESIRSPASPLSDLQGAPLTHSPPVPRLAQVTSPFSDPHDTDDFLSLSPGSHSDLDLDEFDVRSPVVSTASMGGSSGTHDEDFEGSEVSGWTSVGNGSNRNSS